MQRLRTRAPFAFFVLIPGYAALAAVPVNKIILSGDAVPGVPGGTFNNISNSPLVAPDGRIGFTATIAANAAASVTTANDLGSWTFYQGSLNLSVREGSSAAPLFGAGINFAAPTAPNFLHSGGVFLQAGSLSGTGVTTANRRYNLAVTGSGSTLLNRTGDLAPGISGATFSATINSVINGAGTAAFVASIAGTGITSDNDSVLYYGSYANPQILLRKGSDLNLPAPVSAFSTDSLNANGRLIGGGVMKEGFGSITANNDQFEFYSDGTTVHRYFVEGDLAPSIEANVFLPAPAGNAVQNNTQIAYQTELINVFDPQADTIMYVGNPDSPQVLIRGGDAAPGIAPLPGLTQPRIANAAAGGIAGPYSINNSNHVLFAGAMRIDPDTGITAADDEAFWLGQPGSLSLIAREGQTIPGTNLTLGAGFNDVLYNPNVQLNNADQAVFIARLSGPGVVNNVNNFGLFAFDPSLGLQLLIRSGDMLDMGDGLTRTLKGDSTAMRLGGITDSGELIFYGLFSDNSKGIFSIAIPEPSSLATICGALALLARRRGQKRADKFTKLK